MEAVEEFLVAFAGFVWGWPILMLLLGGGLFFLVYSRTLPYRHFRHSLQILSGRYDDPLEDGDLPHYQALSSALSGTLGLGNIAGVAVASTMVTFWYYGTKCLSFLVGTELAARYRYFYTALNVVGAVGSLEVVIAFIDGMYALMAVPTMFASIRLAPRVMAAARIYFSQPS